MFDELARLVALAPDDPLNALVRQTCARAMSLPPLPSEIAPADDATVAEFAEQFAVDVSAVTDAQRRAFAKALGPMMFTARPSR